MGLYPIDCPICKKPFMWFSGSQNQLCHDCNRGIIEKADLAEKAPEKVKIQEIMDESLVKTSSPKRL